MMCTKCSLWLWSFADLLMIMFSGPRLAMIRCFRGSIRLTSIKSYRKSRRLILYLFESFDLPICEIP